VFHLVLAVCLMATACARITHENEMAAKGRENS
jgi:hypothetical protein